MNILSTITSFLGAKKYILIGGLVLAGLAYWYWNYSQDRIEALNQDISTVKANNEALSEKIEQQNKTIDNIVEQTEKNNEAMENLNNNLSNIRQSTSELAEMLREHDLNKLAQKKPKMIERRMNDATKNLFDELESITGNNSD